MKYWLVNGDPDFMAYEIIPICAMVKSRNIGDGHPTFNDGILIMGIYINPYYWVDDHPLLYGNNGSLDPGTYNMSSINPMFNLANRGSDHCSTDMR